MKTITFLFAILFTAGLNSSRAQDAWIQKADFGGTVRDEAVGFSIGSKGYIGTGLYYDSDDETFHLYKDFWEYDPASNTWTQKADFGGTARFQAVGFSIGSKGYLGTGFDTSNNTTRDFWEYDPAANTWTQKADFGGTARIGAAGFSIGNKGYLGTGAQYGNTKDFWEYDPAANTWTQKADFGGTARELAVGFSIGCKGYLGTGYGINNTYSKDFWEYDPATNTWTQKADFGGAARGIAVGFNIGNKGYLGAGNGKNNTLKKDFWEYDADANIWVKKADYAGAGGWSDAGFSIGSKGYVGTGNNDGVYFNDFWEYTPGSSSCVSPVNLSVTNITPSSAKLNWDAVAGAEGYKVRYKISGANGWIKKTTIGTSKIITGLSPNTAYQWEVLTFCQITPPQVTSDWSSKQDFTTASSRMGDQSAQQVSIQIYPNPVQDHATIQFTLPQSSRVFIKVCDVSGKEIETLLDDNAEQGDHAILFSTNHFSKGVYMVRLITEYGAANEKLIVE
ncbi:MAG TPA: kelch repeat-containing protein [Chitinophagales bacterium]|nr:kelch repeat-containing protein [Chitinophagales bacterium]